MLRESDNVEVVLPCHRLSIRPRSGRILVILRYWEYELPCQITFSYCCDSVGNR